MYNSFESEAFYAKGKGSPESIATHILAVCCLPRRSIHDPSTEILVIEVWDSDEETVGVSGIKGVKGLGK